ncbi:hypothetical protein [Paracoccus aminovorans]|uniref:hypothetical protein n=1 Tax=Paracoccus aminovorans TaxID=34004 RepID=UPI002B25FAF2|nr:hypothetical protein [Paracoccus aminovorans]
MARDTEPSRNKAQDQDEPADAGQPEDETVVTGTAAAAGTGQDKTGTEGDGFAQLREHHKALRALLGECANIADGDAAENLLPRLAEAWSRHAEAHGLVHDASVQAGLQEFPLLAEIAIDTDLVSFLLGRADRHLDGPLELAALRVAARLIGDIIEREEKPRNGLFAKAKAAGVEPAALGRRIRACMTAPSDRDGDARPQLRHLMANQEEIMPRNSNMPERDERGRFVSDDDDSGRGGRGSGRYDDDRDRDSRGRFTSSRDDDRGSRSRYDDDRDRDSRGRFTSDRDDDRYASRGRSSRRDDDDDRRYASSRRDDDDRRSYSSRGRDDDYSRDRSQGGWFGDSEGHAEAARRGWDHRRDDDDDRYSSRGRSSRRDDDDDRRYASSRRDDDDRRSYSSRDRDDDYSRDRGQGGWFGDSRGHAEAARRGWDHRRDDDDDGRRYSSRGRR